MLNQDWKEFIELLNKNRVRYLVVGGFAVAYHGRPRYTKDIDIWVDATASNAKRLLKALAEFGFGSLDLSVPDFVKPDHIIQLGYPPSRIDLLTSIPGVEFKKCYKHKVHATMQGVTVNFINLDDLIKNKSTAGRTQDLADVENLRDK